VHPSAGPIGIVQPAPRGARVGNRTTALRWALLLRRLGWRIFVERSWSGRECAALVALHARRSHASLRRFLDAHPGAPAIVAATGTDLYDEQGLSPEARDSFERATRIVVLQERALAALPPGLRPKTHVIHQSAPAPSHRPPPSPDAFEVVVLAHLRAVKDPLLAAQAARALPARSRVRVLLAGAPLDGALTAAAAGEEAVNPRFRWLGEIRRPEALRLVARARLFLSTSRDEGGANAISEALAAGVGVLATRIPGSVGLLGDDHPGLFPSGDAGALAALLERAETDAAFLAELEARSRARAWIADPCRELEAWRALLDELPYAVSTGAAGGPR
jgi:putative glycosyltransferase (TIGR04348 family)